jgi:hypothetical protein
MLRIDEPHTSPTESNNGTGHPGKIGPTEEEEEEPAYLEELEVHLTDRRA